MERKQYQVIDDFYDDDDDIDDDDNNDDDSDDYDDMMITIMMMTMMTTAMIMMITIMMTTMKMTMTLIQVGETAHLSCSVQRSSPPSLLSWYINDEPVCIIIIIIHKSLVNFQISLFNITILKFESKNRQIYI